MEIWVDGDACPGMIKDILFRAADNRKIKLTFVANKYMRLPKSRFIEMLLVEAGFDVADGEILKRLQPGDIVITADIPLASEVIEKGGHALNPRGKLYTDDNIRALLNMRDFMETLRSSGINTGGPPALSAKEKNLFANSLDRLITEYTKKNKKK